MRPGAEAVGMTGSGQNQEILRMLRIRWLALSAWERSPLEPPWGPGVGEGVGWQWSWAGTPGRGVSLGGR